MSVYEIATYTVKPASRAKCEQAIREFVDYVQHNEPGTKLYTALQEMENAANFLHVFVFEDEAAHDRHSNSEAVHRFSSILYPECIAPVKFTEYKLVASNVDFED
jgi:quinol monooxygenase YgiN